MKKMTLMDKLAKKTFESGAIQKSWQVHMQAFGPILEPAFAEDYQSRTHLCAALNYISNRDLEKALKKLQPLQGKCVNDADRVAWLFFMGLIFDMAGLEDAMIDCYQEAAEIGHGFYLPYLKLAKSAHNHGAFAPAEKSYLKAIACLREGNLTEQTELVLASAYINYASCLTMMHRFADAETAIEQSVTLIPVFPGRSATTAVLYAAMGKWERADADLLILRGEAPQLHEHTEQMVNGIRSGEHPHFFPKPLGDEAMAAFWSWFLANEEALAQALEAQKYEELFAELQEQLKALFPFMERDPDVALRLMGDCYEVVFADYYMVALREGYEQLIAARPDGLQRFTEFVIEH